jgi:hypothetical protein
MTGEVTDEPHPQRTTESPERTPVARALPAPRQTRTSSGPRRSHGPRVPKRRRDMMARAGRRLRLAVRPVIRAVKMARNEQVHAWECILLTSGAAPLTAAGPLRWVPSLNGDRLAAATCRPRTRPAGRPGPLSPELLNRVADKSVPSTRERPIPVLSAHQQPSNPAEFPAKEGLDNHRSIDKVVRCPEERLRMVTAAGRDPRARSARSVPVWSLRSCPLEARRSEHSVPPGYRPGSSAVRIKHRIGGLSRQSTSFHAVYPPTVERLDAVCQPAQVRPRVVGHVC